MNYNEIISNLKRKANNKYDVDVLNVVVTYYMTHSNFYESDLISVFDNYLSTGILKF